MSRFVGVRVLDRAPGARCVLCLDELAGPISACSGCGAAWHVECKLEARQARCTTIGCPGGDVVHEVRAVAAEPPPVAAAPPAERVTDVPGVAAPAPRSPWRGGAARLENGLRGAGVALALAFCPLIYAWAATLFFLTLFSKPFRLGDEVLPAVLGIGALGGFVFAAHVLWTVGIRLHHQAVILTAALAAGVAALWHAPRHDVWEAIVAGFFGAAALAGAWVLPLPEDGAPPGS